ncbi:hypothetical protein B0H17DRAFT_1143785 [Mycena rosella]|uniref:Uncharacterized protein n=1 Tax=Mycena rosella TaxID=1033263 RepID=A0AAD7G7G7_MYCRO|nr:hypothetical protein B0H17DRAFT_1143785 [Mycena rosella]
MATRGLDGIDRNIPFGGILSGVIDPLLDIMDHIEVKSVPFMSNITEYFPPAHFVQHKRELQGITKDLEDARSQGKLYQFFNSTDDASALAKHNMTLDQLIADATVHKILRDIEVGHIEMGDIAAHGRQVLIRGAQGDWEVRAAALALVARVVKVEARSWT